MPTTLARWIIVVPARLKSERLQKKPLQDLGGKPLVVRVADNLRPLLAMGARLLIAVDAPEVMETLAKHGYTCVMTDPNLQSGTDRCAAAVSLSGQSAEYVLNVQGDEPFVDTDDLRDLCLAMEARPHLDLGTLVFQSSDSGLFHDPNAVKAIRSSEGLALYFSRSPIPYARSAPERNHQPQTHWHHLGVYAFRRERLHAFVNLPPSDLEQTEKLEQLRALEAGWQIYLQPARSFARGIDTLEDLEAARSKLGH